MNEHEFLYTVAQVGAAYAGFSTLVAVLGHQRLGTAVPGRILLMLLLSIIAVSFALLPTVPIHFGVPEEVSWRVMSGIYAVAWIA